MTEIEAFIREAAQKRGIDPDIAVRVAKSEGGVSDPARAGKFNTGWSFWSFQLHYAMAGQPGVTKPTAGMGEGFTALTGWQPGDPAAWRDAARYALNRAKLGGWGPWYGAKAVGIGTWDGIDRDHPWDADAEPWDYEQGDAVPVKLSEVLARGRSRIGDPYVWAGKAPPRTDCSGFVAWCYDGKLTSFTDAMLNETQRVEKPAPGDVVLYEYKDANQPGVRFPHVGLFISDALTLDNRFGLGVGEHAQLPRSQATRYYRRYPGVIVDTDGIAPSPVVDPKDARIAELEAALAKMRADLDEARMHLGVITVDYAGSLQDLVDAIKALKPAA